MDDAAIDLSLDDKIIFVTSAFHHSAKGIKRRRRFAGESGFFAYARLLPCDDCP